MQFLCPNHAMQTTAAPSGVTTGTAIKTMLQVKPLVPLWVVEWGYCLDGSPSDIKVELIETDVAATVTSYAEADVTKLGNPDDSGQAAIVMTLSTSGSGFTSSSEGSITAVRNLDGPQISSLKAYQKQFPLGERPKIQVAKFGRIRVTAAAAVNMLCYMVLSTTR